MHTVVHIVANAKFFAFPVWFAAQEELDKKRAAAEAQRVKAKEDSRVQREEMRKEMLGEK